MLIFCVISLKSQDKKDLLHLFKNWIDLIIQLNASPAHESSILIAFYFLQQGYER